MARVRILLVEDDPAAASALRKLLCPDRRFALVCEAADGEQAVRRASELSPDLVLMDVQMPGAFDGVEATRRVLAAAAAAGRSTCVVAISSSDERRADMLAAGAAAYVSKRDAGGLPGTLLSAFARGQAARGGPP